MKLKIVSGRKGRTTNRYNEPKRTSAEKGIRSAALGRSLVIGPDPDWGTRGSEPLLEGRPFAYPDLLICGIAYRRYMIGDGVRVEEVADEMSGKDVKGHA